jgi:hypothetical protein
MPSLDQVKDYCRYKSGHCIFVSGSAASQRKTQIETAMPADGMLAAYYPNGNFGSSPTRQLAKTLNDPLDVEKVTFLPGALLHVRHPHEKTAVDIVWLIRVLCASRQSLHTDDRFESGAPSCHILRMSDLPRSRRVKGSVIATPHACIRTYLALEAPVFGINRAKRVGRPQLGHRGSSFWCSPSMSHALAGSA